MILDKNIINGIFGKKIIDKKNKKIMKIYVLGSNGMLGKYVSTFLVDYYNVIKITRNEIDASNIDEENLKNKLIRLGLKEGDVVINCIGTIKPMVDIIGDLNTIKVNSVFPRILANVCENLSVKMIHPTTDCVFTGIKGSYNENDVHDISDVYGRSKSLGEPNNCTVIRTSIIGEEVGQGRSLVEWVKSNKGNNIFGFTNHIWNGVTCLQFGKICKKIIDENLFWYGIKHLHSNNLNKNELVGTISDVYGLNITITPKETPIKCDRSLSTIFIENLEKMEIPDLKTQIIEMKEFSKKLYSN
jgi:dTDP-4-dehydrorhamnose reductase